MNLPEFIMIPHILIRDKNLQPLDREVYGIIYWVVSWKNEKCIMSNQIIGDILGAAGNSVSHSLGRLAKQRYIYIKMGANNQRLEIVPLVKVNHVDYNPSSNEHTPSSNEQHIYIHNNINKEKEETPVTLLLGPLNSRNSISQLSDLDRWNMANELEVPLWVVKEVEKNFWDYIEEPKNRKKYKTTYLTVKRWIKMALDKGKYQHNNEVEVMLLQSQHPNMVSRMRAAREFAEKEKLVE